MTFTIISQSFNLFITRVKRNHSSILMTLFWHHLNLMIYSQIVVQEFGEENSEHCQKILDILYATEVGQQTNKQWSFSFLSFFKTGWICSAWGRRHATTWWKLLNKCCHFYAVFFLNKGFASISLSFINCQRVSGSVVSHSDQKYK